MTRYDDLPYRACVGMMLINSEGLVFIGRRAGGPEHVDATHVWQMPQGHRRRLGRAAGRRRARAPRNSAQDLVGESAARRSR